MQGQPPLFSFLCKCERHKDPVEEENRGVQICVSWQGHKDLNPEPTVLETAALPIELYPYMVGLRGLEPRTNRL